jgi:hypothetical protein
MGDSQVCPSTSYELQREWRALGKVAARAEFLRVRFSPEKLARIFSSVSVEPDLLAEMLQALQVALAERGEGGAGLGLRYMQALAGTHRFDMSAMLLDKQSLGCAKGILDALAAGRDQEGQKEVSQLGKLYGVN